jgi:glycosyltransferase involved in cell wall biosynthesis
VLRIVHLARRFHPLLGGTERYALDLARRQAADGHRVEVVTLDRDIMSSGGVRLPRRDVVDGVHVERLPGWGGPRWAITARPDTLIARVARADVVHLHDLRFHYGLAHLATAARRHRLLIHTHGLFFHTADLARLKVLALRSFYGPIARIGGSVIIADSRTDRDRLIDAVPSLADAVRVIPNAIDLRAARAVERRPEEGALLAFGRLTQSKGLREAIAALALLADRDWRLILAGPEERNEAGILAERAAEMGIADRLTFLGRVDEPALGDLLATASIALFPSRGEGFGLALVEALAAGVPVVTNDIAAHREVLGAELESCLVDFGQPAVAAAGIARLLDDPAERDRLAAAGRDRSRAFDIDRLWLDLQALYPSPEAGR